MKTLVYATIIVSIICIISCNNYHSEKVEANNILDSTTINDGKPDSIKLIKSGYINLKVSNTLKAIEKLNSLTKAFGGMITHQNVESSIQSTTEHQITYDSLLVISAFTPRADVVIRVPSARLFDFLDSIHYLSTFISQSRMDIEDKSFTYLANELKQKSRINLLNKINSKKLHTEGMIFSLEKADEIVDNQIENKEIDNDVQYSNVSLNLYQDAQIKKEVVANYNTSDYDVSLSKRLLIAIQDGWSFFIDILLVICRLWAFILIGTLLVIVYRNKRISYLKTK